jgi:hypothetical protein
MQHLANVIRGQEQPQYTTTHDLTVQEVLLQASQMALDDR